MSGIAAHLNGGPRDDQFVTVSQPVYYVPLPMRIKLTALPLEDAPVEPFTPVGVYRMRLDSFGQPVPHDLTGIVEFDFEGAQ